MRCDPAGEDGAFTVWGYPAQLSQCKEGRRHWVEAQLTVPPSWPLFTLIRPDGQNPPHSSGEIKSGWVRLDDHAGCELWTPDAPATRALFALGLAEVVARHPLVRLRIGGPASSLRWDFGTRMDAETAQWTREVIEAMLLGAPSYESLGLVDMAPGVAWTQEHLDRDLGITPPDEAG